MQKRGQLTLFIILGIIIIAGVILIFFLKSDMLKKSTEREITSAMSLSESVSAVENIVQGCLDEALTKSFFKCGVANAENYQNCLKQNIKSNLYECMDFEDVSAEVYAGELENLKVSFGAGGKKIVADAEINILIKVGKDSERVKHFYSEFMRVY
ncbi:MAG: hypothetical protein U9Q69_04885 [Nanoarchaeota archaeon]|nr:hypothetical protein [Nanoarchaeota archaeon]